MTKNFIWITFLFCINAHALSDQVTELLSLSSFKNRQYAGYLSATSSASLFYWYVESDFASSEKPLVLWLNGGPGASSLYGFFMENGPFKVNDDGTLERRNFSWTRAANYLVIDQPLGVGYSFGNPSEYKDEPQAIEQLYNALLAFYKKHPELMNHQLILAGESYAGKYLPQLAMHILKHKKIAISGILLGDPWINPLVQQHANIDYAYFHGLIDGKTRETLRIRYQQCVSEIKKKSPTTPQANQVCDRIQQTIKVTSGHLNLANIITGKEPSDAPIIRYLNRPDVRKALHVPANAPAFATFSDAVAKKLETGEQDSVSEIYSQLLSQGIPILIYNGLEDGKDSNFLSTELLIPTFQWPTKTEFDKANTCVWRKRAEVYGYVKTGGGLTQVKVRGAGHLAPIDQPERVFDLFVHMIQGKPLC